jgi:hypothetical protein
VSNADPHERGRREFTALVRRSDSPDLHLGRAVAGWLRLAGVALIRKFDHKPDARIAFRTEVDCGWTVGDTGAGRILHLETYGSSTRDIPGKVSQSLEIDEDGARELERLIRVAFPDLEK